VSCRELLGVAGSCWELPGVAWSWIRWFGCRSLSPSDHSQQIGSGRSGNVPRSPQNRLAGVLRAQIEPMIVYSHGTRWYAPRNQHRHTGRIRWVVTQHPNCRIDLRVFWPSTDRGIIENYIVQRLHNMAFGRTERWDFETAAISTRQDSPELSTLPA